MEDIAAITRISPAEQVILIGKVINYIDTSRETLKHLLYYQDNRISSNISLINIFFFRNGLI